jgi:hypothetical protein
MTERGADEEKRDLRPEPAWRSDMARVPFGFCSTLPTAS